MHDILEYFDNNINTAILYLHRSGKKLNNDIEIVQLHKKMQLSTFFLIAKHGDKLPFLITHDMDVLDCYMEVREQFLAWF